MTKRTFFVGAGAVVLAASAALAGRASVKASPSTIYVSTTGGNCRALTVQVTSANTFTTGGTGTQATIRTSAGLNSRKMWGAAGCASAASPKPLHFKG